MLKSTGIKKTNIAVFISGTGTNFKNLIQYSLKKQSKFIIKLIVSNNVNAKGLEYAKKFKIFINKLKNKNISLICLAGFMKILNKNFILRFKKKILNVHPSLLPKYKGLDTFNRVLKSKDKITGCTIHYVNEKLDSGKIILQKKVLIEPEDNNQKLRLKVQKQEYRSYSEAIYKIFAN